MSNVAPPPPPFPARGTPEFNADANTFFLWMASFANALNAFEAYGRQNAVGTVSESGGVPTGALFNRGSNSNGRWTRFADGTLICRHSLTISSGGEITWTFPVPFAITPVVMCSAAITTAPRVVTAGTPTDTSVVLRGWDGATPWNGTLRAYAIGEWF